MKLDKSVFSGSLFSLSTVVEGEVNGLFSYDRKVIKLEEDRLRAINQQVCNVLGK